PDGRWMAYDSSEAGPSQVFVRPFPGGPGAGKWQISNGPGRFPLWSPNGHELFYLALSGDQGLIMVAGYTARGDSFMAEKPRECSPARIQSAGIRQYDLAPGGKRFVVFPAEASPGAAGAEKTSVQVTVLQNFFDELKRRVPLK